MEAIGSLFRRVISGWQDLARATFTRVGSVNAEINAFPIWTADGEQLVYRGSTGLSLQSVDGRGAPRVLAQTSDFDYPAAVTAFTNNQVQLAWFGGFTGV